MRYHISPEAALKALSERTGLGARQYNNEKTNMFKAENEDKAEEANHHK